MSNVNIIADFETSLATKIAVGGETATLVSNIDDDGETLPDGLYNFTIDGNNSSKEHIICTKTGANLTAIKSVSRQGVESVGVVREHRVGAKVIMTDFSTFKNYIDNIAIAGAVAATNLVAGVAKLSVAAVAPATPIVVGDNDPRLVAAALVITVGSVLHPIGSIYTSVIATNPAVLFGFGTWTAWGTGRVPVGIDGTQTEFDTVEETGGAKTHTLSIDEMPAHTHTGGVSNVDTNAYSPGTSNSDNIPTGSTGGGQAHNNLQPYIVCYMWKRTA